MGVGVGNPFCGECPWRAGGRTAVRAERYTGVERRSHVPSDDETVFVAKAAHELRGAVGGIELLANALAELVDQRGADDPQLSAILIQLAARSAHIETMAHQLLDLARFGDGQIDLHPRAVDVASIVDAVLHQEPSAPHHRVTVDVAEGLVVETDPLALEQIVVNLVRNAYRHGGTSIVIDATVGDGVLALVVADDGPGVPEHIRPRLFEPFVRSSFAAGHGLGLAIVAEIADALGGQVRYESNEPTGARFCVTIPVN